MVNKDWSRHHLLDGDFLIGTWKPWGTGDGPVEREESDVTIEHAARQDCRLLAIQPGLVEPEGPSPPEGHELYKYCNLYFYPGGNRDKLDEETKGGITAY